VYAQSTRTWISGVGDDVNPCSRTAPCKTFAGAFSKTAAGGEISILDPGEFGSLTITKSITLAGPAASTSISSSIGTIGITVAAGAADVVTLKNISFNGTNGVGLYGVKYVSGARVNIENCNFNNFSTACVNVDLTTAGQLNIFNTVMSSNITTSMGVMLNTSTDSVAVTMDNVNLSGFYNGINDSSHSYVTLKNCIITNCVTAVSANGVNGKSAFNLINSTLSFNGTGIKCIDAQSECRIFFSNIFNNNIGLDGLGKIISFGNNKIAGNGINFNTLYRVIK